MNEMNFSNNSYKDIAFNLQYINNNTHSPEDAFFLLINGVDFENLSNLCELIKEKYNSSSSDFLSINECYMLTQNLNLNGIDKTIIMDLAYECIKSGKDLGNKTINNGTINTSSWLSHCVFASEVCSSLAETLGLNPNEAKTLGLMHDYGRKFNHSFNHTIDGFEHLINIGWINEAIGCLTHSFVNGGRCSNNEKAADGFYLDENGEPQWEKDTVKDDLTIFLENYKYTDYDLLLNIADLMATSYGIIPPHERISDIATRRAIDKTNRAYFLADFTNLLIDFLKKANYIDNSISHIKATKETTEEQINAYFQEISKYFFEFYKNIPNQKSNSYNI